VCFGVIHDWDQNTLVVIIIVSPICSVRVMCVCVSYVCVFHICMSFIYVCLSYMYVFHTCVFHTFMCFIYVCASYTKTHTHRVVCVQMCVSPCHVSMKVFAMDLTWVFDMHIYMYSHMYRHVNIGVFTYVCIGTFICMHGNDMCIYQYSHMYI